MVEGPQCNLKSQRLAAAGVVGQRVVRALGSAGTNGTNGTNATLPARLASAGPILRVVAIGKECFVVFGE